MTITVWLTADGDDDRSGAAQSGFCLDCGLRIADCGLWIVQSGGMACCSAVIVRRGHLPARSNVACPVVMFLINRAGSSVSSGDFYGQSNFHWPEIFIDPFNLWLWVLRNAAGFIARAITRRFYFLFLSFFLSFLLSFLFEFRYQIVKPVTGVMI